MNIFGCKNRSLCLITLLVFVLVGFVAKAEQSQLNLWTGTYTFNPGFFEENIVNAIDKPVPTPSVQTVPFSQEASDQATISSPSEARYGVVRIFTTDDPSNPTWFSTGSGFGVGAVGAQTDIFLTNRHVVWDDQLEKIADHVYIMLDDGAIKRSYSTLGGFIDEETQSTFKLDIQLSHMVRCEVLYPTSTDPEYPDFAILRAEEPISGRIALPLVSTETISDTTSVWTIGYPGSADQLYNMDSAWEEMQYEADVEGSQVFAGTISRRGRIKDFGNTFAVTHSAQIDHGNSGGPLVTKDGCVIGINTYGFGSSETSSVAYYMSIYIDYAMKKLDEMGIAYNQKAQPEDLVDIHSTAEPIYDEPVITRKKRVEPTFHNNNFF